MSCQILITISNERVKIDEWNKLIWQNGYYRRKDWSIRNGKTMLALHGPNTINVQGRNDRW